MRLGEAARAAVAGGLSASRSGRLARRLAGQPAARVGLGELVVWPTWPGRDEAERDRIWRIAALVASRDALADIIYGATLRSYATSVGNRVVEAVLDLPTGGTAPLVGADDLSTEGLAIAERGLPPLLAVAMDRPAIHDETARRHMLAAERIARETRP
ncbi:hypothetical protein NX02_15865 [Sphingomonas sanxanigenens DSM 19645 = NX02]|uniref:Uncharacterized protein n=1 Tax=Sphingomonas sanxanigenens DSM 19645 = NX02 TaxID=1123269 RepID=W0AEX8_9SPHN|nr:hypothetical protein NX02_15865 [Sphingomonas sanxanigenens DSM 19645 = NX02]